jgi:HAD superfamily hydrolase (TIGR01509 family)
VTASHPGWELVIFDCDGVLVDSEPIQNRVLHRMLTHLGWSLDYEETIETFIGRSLRDCLKIAEQRLGRVLGDDFERRLQDETFAAFERDLRPVAGVEQALDSVSAPVCVASSGSLDKMRKTLSLTGLLPRFEDRMFSALELARGKPFPDLFLYAARTMRVNPKACAVVEDAPVGVEAGIAAGMTVFGFAAAGQGEALAAAGAVIFDDMRQLPELLLKQPPPRPSRTL